MVARFVNGKSIRGILHYNENKVAAGEATLLLASGFATEIKQLNLEQKAKRFEQLTMLNNRTHTNAVHISLNFDVQDKLNTEALQQISMAYMERIGFGDQPYVVYRHTDAAHLHVHIATVNIRADGSRIDTHGIGWKLSEPARTALEKEYGLVQAKDRTLSNQLGIKPANIEKAVYGRSPTKRAITNIVSAVIRDYKFTSLAEFNAVLGQFNVMADRGGENTLMREKGGLLYSLIGEIGGKVGVPIKASAIYNKPTLTNLQQEFERNAERRLAYKEPLKQTIGQLFRRYHSLTRKTFMSELQKQNIQVLFRSNDDGRIYGITFIDHRHRTVFNGSDLGKAYSAKAIIERFGINDSLVEPRQMTIKQTDVKNQLQTHAKASQTLNKQTHLLPLTSGKHLPHVAPTVRRKKKKRKGAQQDQELGL